MHMSGAHWCGTRQEDGLLHGKHGLRAVKQGCKVQCKATTRRKAARVSCVALMIYMQLLRVGDAIDLQC
jgi:hypothetical protein